MYKCIFNLSKYMYNHNNWINLWNAYYGAYVWNNITNLEAEFA